MINKTQKQIDRQNQNRLIGWLVSYALDEKGFSYKLIAGRTFIAQSKNSEIRTLSIDDDSISSPHLVLKAGNDNKLYAEDIFSDFGSFVQHPNGDEEQIFGPTELSHGDWIRIGNDTRLQVCLIDGQSK